MDTSCALDVLSTFIQAADQSDEPLSPEKIPVAQKPHRLCQEMASTVGKPSSKYGVINVGLSYESKR